MAKKCHFLLFGPVVKITLMMVILMISKCACDDDLQELLLHDHYYTLHQYHNHVSLKINVDGEIEWDAGTPTLYSVFREQIVRSDDDDGDGNHGNGILRYTLEATATRYWVCMTGKGRLYTVHQQHYHRLERQRLERLENLKRIRHEVTKRTRRRWRQGQGQGQVGGDEGVEVSSQRIYPPSDCLFQTFEFNPNESYERSVGIYSSAHSNLTHGRFLSVSPGSLEVRSYRRPFSRLHHHHQLKITQVPIRYLSSMVNVTRFGRGMEYNGRVRQCIHHLLRCPNHQKKIVKNKKKRKRRRPGRNTKERRSDVGGGEDEDNGGDDDDDDEVASKVPKKEKKRRRSNQKNHNHHFYKLIERCKKRGERTDKPPTKCMKSVTTTPTPPNSGGGSGGKSQILRRGRRRRRRKSQIN